MEFSDLLDKIDSHFQAGFPFIVYLPPRAETISGSFQRSNNTFTTHDFNESGFVFASFSQDKTLLIPDDESDSISVRWIPSNVKRVDLNLATNTEEKDRHIQLVQNSLKAIEKKGLIKIVVSRKEIVPLKSLELTTVVHRLFNLYETAFRYVWFHPSSGLWVGATPEVLLQVDGKDFSTMALAGTQKYVEGREPKWGVKELLEQQWVTNDIADKLQKVTGIVKVSQTRNHVAGSLVHLRTDFNGVFPKGGSNLAAVIKNLHPTPAVCGLPRNLAYDFILSEEGYDREFYTGYLGCTADGLSTAELYVNLRCMKITGNEAHVYVGGGITQDSIPQLEWEETQNKKQTMLQVLAPMLSN
ncbi:MAG: chorismate-binding protein [Aureisphaera sp.]